jgi:hypothetical protein
MAFAARQHCVEETTMRPEASAGRSPDRRRRTGLNRKANAATPEEAAAEALTLQFLDFIGEGRAYGETMEAWRSSCPRMPVWENAVHDGLVRIESGCTMRSSRIVLTAKGAARLQSSKF